MVGTLAVASGLGFLSAMLVWREKSQRVRFWWSMIGVGSFAVSSACLAGLLLRMHTRSWGLIWAAVAVVVIGLVFWILLLIGNYARDHGTDSLRTRLRLAGRVCLPGWRSLGEASYRAEDVREASKINMVINVGAAILVVPGIAGVLIVAILMNVRDSETSDFLSHAVGYYTLLLATAWTVSYLLTILLVTIVQVVRGNKSEITLTKVAISLGTWAGFGAAGGVFVGTLIPLVVVPLAKGGFHALGTSLLDSISPSLLLDISTAGAVFGFLVGEVISLVQISGGEQNLYVKAVAPPIVFAGLTTVLGLAGLTPGKLSDSLSTEYKKTVLSAADLKSTDHFKTALSEGLDTQSGWANAVAGFDKGGWNTMVDHYIFYLATWVVAVLVVLFSLTLAIHEREEVLLSGFRDSKPVTNGGMELAPVVPGEAEGEVRAEAAAEAAGEYGVTVPEERREVRASKKTSDQV